MPSGTDKIHALNHAFRLRLQAAVLFFPIFLKAEASRAALKRAPEQFILSEVRHLVEDMQALNKKLDETDDAIKEYFKPLNKQADMIINHQLESEEKSMREMAKVIRASALEENALNAKSMERSNLISEPESQSENGQPR